MVSERPTRRNGFSDIHCHLLPGVDDGAGNLEESVEMLRRAQAAGAGTVVATPHLYSPHFETLGVAAIRQRYSEFVVGLHRLAERPAHFFLARIRCLLGGEHYVGPEFLDAIGAGEVLPLNDSRYLLIEFSPFLPLSAMLRATEVVAEHGLVSVIAHVERYQPFQHRPADLTRFIAAGCVTQLNAASAVGAEGRRLRGLALDLLDRGLIHLIASDGHDPVRRPPELASAARTLARRYTRAAVDGWLRGAAEKILADRPVEELRA